MSAPYRRSSFLPRRSTCAFLLLGTIICQSTQAAQAPTEDSLWYYDSMGEVPLSGMAGYVVLRNGNVVGSLTMLVS